MLVLVSFGLVLLATILLVVGLLNDDGLTLIYLSIGASFTAAVVLYLAFRRSGPKADVGSEAPSPLADDIAPSLLAEDVTAVRRADEATGVVPAAAPAPAAVAVDTAATDDEWGADDTEWEDEVDDDFPIADYDELTVAEILPLLPQLYSDELPLVGERERNGKSRSTILKRLDELGRTGTEADAAEAASVAEAEPAAPAPAVEPISLSDEEDDGYLFPIADYDDLSVSQILPLLPQLELDELEDVRAREVAGADRSTLIAEIDRYLSGELEAFTWEEDDESAAEAPAATTGRASTSLPIVGYDDLTVAEIRPRLADLSPDELERILDHEAARDNRKTIVNEIERRLDSAAPAPAPAPARKAPAKKRAARASAPAQKATKAATKSAKKSTKKSAKKATKRATRFPIANYDELTVADIRPRLTSLSDNQLAQVRERELAGAGRRTILNDIDSRLG